MTLPCILEPASRRATDSHLKSLSFELCRRGKTTNENTLAARNNFGIHAGPPFRWARIRTRTNSEHTARCGDRKVECSSIARNLQPPDERPFDQENAFYLEWDNRDRKSTRLNSSHRCI